jgi:Na+/phosphate symporter
MNHRADIRQEVLAVQHTINNLAARVDYLIYRHNNLVEILQREEHDDTIRRYVNAIRNYRIRIETAERNMETENNRLEELIEIVNRNAPEGNMIN